MCHVHKKSQNMTHYVMYMAKCATCVTCVVFLDVLHVFHICNTCVYPSQVLYTCIGYPPDVVRGHVLHVWCF